MTPTGRRPASDEDEELPPEEVEVPPFEYEVRSSGGASNLILRCDACEGSDALADPRCLAAVLQALGEEYHVDLITLSGRTMRQYSGETVQLLRQVLEMHKLLQQLSTRPPQPVLDGVVVPGADLEDLIEDLYRQSDIEAARAPLDEDRAEEEREEELRRQLGPGAKKTPPSPPPVRPGASDTGALPAYAASRPASPPASIPGAGAGSGRSGAPGGAPSPPGGVATSDGELSLEDRIAFVEKNKGSLQRRLKRLDCPDCAFNPRAFFPDLEESLRTDWGEFLQDLKEKVQVLGTGRPEEECVRCLGVTVSDLELVSQELSELVGRVRGLSTPARRGGEDRTGGATEVRPDGPGGRTPSSSDTPRTSPGAGALAKPPAGTSPPPSGPTDRTGG